MGKKKRGLRKPSKKAVKSKFNNKMENKLKSTSCIPECEDGFVCRQVHQPGGGFKNICVPIED